MHIKIKEETLRKAAAEGMDAFIEAVVQAMKDGCGGELTAEALQKLTPDQVTLWGWHILHSELMDGGYVQLIHNGYGPFFFDNPFPKAMKLWGLRDLSKQLYKARKLYMEHKDKLTQDCSDEDFMALFEQFPEFDGLDDEFVEEEERLTAMVAAYVDDHLYDFVETETD